MADRVGADPFCRQRGHLDLRLAYVPLDECVDAKAGNRMTAAIEKNRRRGGSVCDEGREFCNGDRPQWAVTLFATFAADLH
jgi:hypothetical protein